MIQLSLLPEIVEDIEIDPDWADTDCWETPDHIARYIAAQVPKGKQCAEIAAGSGMIAQHLPKLKGRRQHLALEINPERVSRGQERAPYCEWRCGDALLLIAGRTERFSCVVTNPPFSKLPEFLAAGVKLLEQSDPTARLLYLLPCDAFQAKRRNAALQHCGLVVHHRHDFVGRIAYLKEGLAMKDRQVCDSLFDLRLSGNASVTYIPASLPRLIGVGAVTLDYKICPTLIKKPPLTIVEKLSPEILTTAEACLITPELS